MLSRRTFTQAIAAAAALVTVPAQADERVIGDDAIRDILRRRIDAQKRSVGMAVGVVCERHRRFVNWGRARLADPEPVTSDTVFEIGSITKVFTALLLANMVRHGEVAFDDPVIRHLPGDFKLPDHGRPITLADLATHTAGLPRMPVFGGEPFSMAWRQNLARYTTAEFKNWLAAGHPALLRLSRSKLHKILRQGELRPHKIRYYVEKRDPDFEIKMASVLHVYKEVEIANEYRRTEGGRQLGMVTISYDEKPGIQALATTTPDRPPVVGTHPGHLRDGEYVRLGTVSLLAGLDLHSGRVTETVSDTHNSSDFIAFLQKLDRAYPEHHQIRLVLDNHSAHISKETRGYLQTMPQRFVFVFTPKHGSWLNLIENQFSKMTRTMLRGIRVDSKQELIDRIHQYFEEINAAPVVFRWKYKLEEIIIV